MRLCAMGPSKQNPFHGIMPSGHASHTEERKVKLVDRSSNSEVVEGRKVTLRIGVDMGGNDIKFGATNLSAERILLPKLVKRPSLTQEGPEKTVAQTIDGIQSVLDQLEAEWSDVADIAVTVPCPCSAEGVIVEATNIGTPETKEIWRVPFGDLLAGAVRDKAGLEIPVFACNDANAAGQDDDFVRFGWDTSRRTSVFVTTGTGLGGCLIIDGAVFFGRGQAGELGHVKPAIPPAYQDRFAQDEAPRCGCGALQCAETRAALAGLVSRLEWALSEQGSAFIGNELESAGLKLDTELLELLRDRYRDSPRRAAYDVRTYADSQQDPFCRWLLEDWAIIIGALFASLSPVLHPDHFIIGGGLTEMSSESRDWFISIVQRVYGEVNAQSCFDSTEGNCEIIWSVSRDQGWRGAILMGMRAREAGTV